MSGTIEQTSDDPSAGVPPDASRRRPRLTRTDVLEAALRLVDDEGLDMLTMRRLGQLLGRDPMGLYRYAPSRAELLDGIVEVVMAELPAPAPDGDWRHELRVGAHAFRRMALAHPHVVPLIVTRPLATPLGLRPLGVLRPLEQLLSLLTAAGFGSADALHAYRAYTGLVTGHVLNELQEVVVDPEETIGLLQLGLHRLPAREFPTIRGLADALGHYDGAAELDRAIDLLIDGLESERTRSSPPDEVG